jgi:coproporphyrinogen III oxidase
MTVARDDVADRLRSLQQRICRRFEELDGVSRFGSDRWTRPEGGGGDTRILQGEGPLEKAAVNWSAVWGPTPSRLSESLAAGSSSFYATGLSIIVHPRNPYAPTFHANLRYFETDRGDRWFGGGADLTPHYLFEEDASHFHRTLAEVCGRHPVGDYPAWKQACDDYFYLPHRGERRGVGGVFFDHLAATEPTWELVYDLGEALTDLYLPILHRRIGLDYTERQVRWQLHRRARYAEFNLIWDRGTRFGLETGGRTESILASLPPRATWVYGFEPEPGSPEDELQALLRGEPRSWL